MSDENPNLPPEEGEERPSLPVWKKAAFAIALVLGLVGVGLTQAGSGEQKAAPTSGDVTPMGMQPAGFDVGEILGEEAAAEQDASPWGPFFIKGGLSFAIAFAAGYALRTFLKMTIVIAGVVALAIFGLQKAGIVGEIDWAKAQGYWDSLTANVGQQFESFKTFLTGSLPSAAMGTMGLVAGFRR